MEDTRLKQRIVGAIVLVSLAVIFIPMILTGGDTAIQRISGTTIPEKPETEFVSRIIPLDKQAPEPASLNIHIDKSQPSSPPGGDSKIAASAPPEPENTATTTLTTAKSDAEPARPARKTLPTAPKVVDAWVAQLGSFSSKKNAYALRDKLRGKGFPTAFVDSVHQKDKTTYRVRIGPEVKKDRASDILARAEKISKTKGFVTRYP